MSGAVDKQLHHDESEGFYEHIEICGSCREEYELEKLTKAYIKRKITFVDVPYDVERAVISQFSSRTNEITKRGLFARLLSNSIFQPILAIGIVIALGVFLFFANKSNIILPVSGADSRPGLMAKQDALSLAEINFQDILSGKFKPKITAVSASDVAAYIAQNAGYSVQLPVVTSVDWVGGTVSDYNGNKMAEVVYKFGEDYIYICSFPSSAMSSQKIFFPQNCTQVIENNGWFWSENSNGDTQAAWGNSNHISVATSNLGKSDLAAYLKSSNNNAGAERP